METLVIGFSRSKKKLALFSWLIMLCEKTKFSHTYFKIHSNSLNRDIIYQANGSGVFFVGLKKFEQDNQIVVEYSISIDQENKTKLLQWAIDESGKSYSFIQIIGILCKRIAKLFGKNINNPFANGDFAIYKGGSIVQESNRRLFTTVSILLGLINNSVGASGTPMAIVTVNGTQAIEGRFRAIAGTIACDDRSMALVRLA